MFGLRYYKGNGEGLFLIKIRAIFEKCGRAKYISHLDLNRCMQRAFKRSGIPIWYTEGFNPHIYINFALPLSLGYESKAEIMDFNITEQMPFEEIMQKLNSAMPEGLKITKVYTPETKQTEIKYSDFKITFDKAIKADFENFISQDTINTIKKTKRGEKEIDLKPDIKVLSCEEINGNTVLSLRLPAGNDKNINPSLITDLLLPVYCEKTSILSVERTGVLNADEKEFI